jgi:hypothetical protein
MLTHKDREIDQCVDTWRNVYLGMYKEKINRNTFREECVHRFKNSRDILLLKLKPVHNFNHWAILSGASSSAWHLPLFPAHQPVSSSSEHTSQNLVSLRVASFKNIIGTGQSGVCVWRTHISPYMLCHTQAHTGVGGPAALISGCHSCPGPSLFPLLFSVSSEQESRSSAAVSPMGCMEYL